ALLSPTILIDALRTSFFYYFFFFFHHTSTTEIYTLSLHDALPIFKPAIEACGISTLSQSPMLGFHKQMDNLIKLLEAKHWGLRRSEERFSRNAETDLVCRLLLEKKKKTQIIINNEEKSIKTKRCAA